MTYHSTRPAKALTNALKGMIGTPPPARARKVSKPLVMRNALRDIAHAETLEDAVRLANDALRQV